MVSLAQFGVLGGIILAALLGVRVLLLAVVVLWSLKADKAGRTHALALLRVLRVTPLKRDRSP